MQDMGGRGGTKNTNMQTPQLLHALFLILFIIIKTQRDGRGRLERRGHPDPHCLLLQTTHSKRTGGAGGEHSYRLTLLIHRAECLSAIMDRLLIGRGHSQKTDLHCSPRPQPPVWSTVDREFLNFWKRQDQ